MRELQDTTDHDNDWQTLHTTWDGVDIEIRYNPCWMSLTATDLGRIEIQTIHGEPLPVSKEGWAGCTTDRSYIDEDGGIEPYVHAWLDDAARDPKWRAGEVSRRQLSLF